MENIQIRPNQTDLEDIIENRKIKMLYQPIVDLKTGEIMGYEALARGPENSPLFSPIELFRYAEENQRLFALEQLCREEAIKNVVNLKSDQRLFLNMNAEVVNDPNFQNGKTKKSVSERGFRHDQVTFEITERTAINDFESFCRSLCHYREQGYSIAVDDAGAGYSSLQSIVELKPEYIKLDMSIIREIHSHPQKRVVVEAMVKMATAVSAKVIAEGVETREELIELHKLGVHFIQGYYLAKPNFPSPEVNPEALTLIQRLNSAKKNRESHLNTIGLGLKIGDIAELNPVIEKETPVSTLKKILEKRRLNGIVVVEKQRPIGLVMKNQLYFRLGTNYGVSLYENRPVGLVMDTKPLIVEADMSLEDVSQIAMGRDEFNLYDLIVVVEKGLYAGVISIMNLLNQITKIQISCAHNSNPLTGLPGNLVIEARLKDMLEFNKLVEVLYIDLDNFKAYNDKYGFERGDQVILFTAQLLNESLAALGCGQEFLGHIGGDDFVMITCPEHGAKIAQDVIARFDKEIINYYDSIDLAKGYIEVPNRHGLLECYPIISISIAIITNIGRFHNYLEIGEVAADLKKLAKQQQCSVVVSDRRVIL